MLCSDFPLCGCYASSFLDQGGFTYSFFSPCSCETIWGFSCISVTVWEIRASEAEGWLAQGRGEGRLGCMGPSDRCTAMLRVLLQRTAACTVKEKKLRLIAGWKSSTGMHSLGFLSTGTAFGASVHKKDGLHLSHAWLVVVILLALFITEAYMLVLFHFPS